MNKRKSLKELNLLDKSKDESEASTADREGTENVYG